MAMEPARQQTRIDQIWQIPVFLLGIVALLAVWLARPQWQPSPAARLKRDLDQLQSIIVQRTASMDGLPAVVSRLQNSGNTDWDSPNRNLLAAGLTHLAELTEKPSTAQQYWEAAHQQLQAIDPKELTAEGQLRYQQNLTRLIARDSSQNPAQVLELINKYQPTDEERAEFQRLAAVWYNRTNPPLETQAREAYWQFLKLAPPRTPGRQLAEARLEIGKISLRLNEPEEARKSRRKSSSMPR
jgi:hypothetical protein